MFGGGAIFQGWVVLHFYVNFNRAILRLMPDDAFYYLTIARNIASGLGSVFSAGEQTNGYHPLWMAILVLLHLLTRLQRRNSSSSEPTCSRCSSICWRLTRGGVF